MSRFSSGIIGIVLASLALGCSSSDSNPIADTSPGDDVFFDGIDPDALLEIGPDGSCGGTTIKATARDANVLLVVDKSGSMNQKPSGFSVTKWSALSTALNDALDKSKTRLSLGL